MPKEADNSLPAVIQAPGVFPAKLLLDFRHLHDRPASAARSALPADLAINAQDDIQAAEAFLGEYMDSPETFRKFTKEIERLFLWLHDRSQHRPQVLGLRDLKLDEIRAYEAFLQDPQPRGRWCSPNKVPRFKHNQPNPAWRPFTGPLSASSANTARGVLKSFFKFLHDAGYLSRNPYALRRRRRQDNPFQQSIDEQRTAVRQKFLAADFRDALVEALNLAPRKTTLQRKRYERARYAVYLFLYQGVRLSEAVSNQMGSIYQGERSFWKMKLIGKGQKVRNIAVHSQYLQALKRYRHFLGLPALPSPSDKTPLLPSITGKRPITARAAHNLIKDLIMNAGDLLQESAPNRAAQLRLLAAHAFRHTYITLMDEADISRKHRKLQAGHSKDETAQIYEHAEDQELHLQIEKLEIGLALDD